MNIMVTRFETDKHHGFMAVSCRSLTFGQASNYFVHCVNVRDSETKAEHWEARAQIKARKGVMRDMKKVLRLHRTVLVKQGNGVIKKMKAEQTMGLLNVGDEYLLNHDMWFCDDSPPKLELTGVDYTQIDGVMYIACRWDRSKDKVEGELYVHHKSNVIVLTPKE
jgi:hypothetical protein